MKILSLVVLSAFLSLYSFAQKTLTLNSNVGELIAEGRITSPILKLSRKKLSSENQFILAYKEGYATQGFSYDDLSKIPGAQYTIALKPTTRLDVGKNSKRIQVTKVLNKVERSYDNYESKIYSRAIGTKIQEWGYDVVGLDHSIFDDKEKNADIAISAEVRQYATEIKKNVEYKVSILVHWTVFDLEEKKVVYQTTTGGYSGKEFGLTETKEFRAAMDDAVLGFVTDPEFAKVISNENPRVDQNKILIDTLELFNTEATEYKSTEKMLKATLNASVLLESKAGQTYGVLINNKGYLLSTVQGQAEETIKVIFNNGIKLPALLISENKSLGMALYKLSGSGYPSLPLASSPVDLNTKVFFIGCDEKGASVQSTACNIKESNKTSIKTDLDTKLNMSCGGFLVNETGEVIGATNGKGALAELISIQEILRALKITLN